jgi:hypothetical protein
LKENFELNRALAKWGFFFAKLLSLTLVDKEKSGRSAVNRTAIAPYKFNTSKAFGTKQQAGKMVSFAAFLAIRTKKSSPPFCVLQNRKSIFLIFKY